MQIDKYTSDKLKVMSFASIILVLYIHSGFHDIPSEIQGMKTNFYIQEMISSVIGRTAVPMFFMISGMLFFRNINDLGNVLSKMKKRARTLLVPFLIAGLFLPAVYLVMGQLPWTAQFINSNDMFSGVDSVWTVLQSLYLYVPGVDQPWGFHLWFLRDLIIIIAFGPILYLARKRLGGGIVVAALFCLTYISVKLSLFTSMFWFMTGDWLLMKSSKVKSWLWVIIYFVVSVCQMLMPNEVWDYFLLPITLMGVLALWSFYDYIVGADFNLKEHRLLTTICQFTFFIYLYHEPTINILRKLMIIPLGRSSLGFAVNYILSPWIFVLIAVPVGMLMKKYIPKIYSILVGGR